MNIKKNIKNISFLWIGSLLGSGSTFLIYIILARKLSTEEFGIFSSALSLLTIFILIGGFGISQFWLKVFGKEGWDAIRWIKPSLQFLFINILFISILISLWSIYGPHNDSYTQNILLIMILFVIGQIIIELVGVKFQLEEKYLKLSIWQLMPNILRLISIFITFEILNNIDIIDISIIYATVSIIFILIGLSFIHKINNGELNLIGHIKKITTKRKSIKLYNIFFKSWPFGLSVIFSFIYAQSDIIIIKYLYSDEAAAYYNVSFIIVSAILLFPIVFYQKFLMPKIHRWSNTDQKKFYMIYKKGNLIMLISGLSVMIITYFLSELLIITLFGEKYIYAVELLKLAIVNIPILFIAFSLSSTLVTKNHMKRKVKYMFYIAILNVVLNLLVVPTYGAIGAIYTTLLSNTLLLLMYFYATEKYVFNTKKVKNVYA